MQAINPWHALGTVAPTDLADTTLQLHWAAQYLAAAGQSFAEPADDDSHRAMTWNAERREFVSAPFAHGYAFRVALRPQDLTLQLLDQTDAPLGSLPLGGQAREDGFDWLAAGLATYMGAVPEIGRPEYDMPEHPVESGATFAADRDAELAALAALYGSAAELLGRLAGEVAGASPVRCWPHHFDIATLITLEGAGEDAKTIGVGMAPMGGGYDSWYWYVTPWPYPDADALPELEGPGTWHTEGWVGAVLTGEEVVAADAEFREAMVKKFVDVGVAACAEVLRG